MKKKHSEINKIFILLYKQKKEEEIYQELIKNNYDINEQNTEGNTLLAMNFARKYNKNALYLIEKGADTNICNYSGTHPFSWILIDSNIEIFNELKKRKNIPYLPELLKYIRNEKILIEYFDTLTFENIENIVQFWEENKNSLKTVLNPLIIEKNIQIFSLKTKIQIKLIEKGESTIKKI